MNRKPRKLQTQIVSIFLVTLAIVVIVNTYIIGSMRSVVGGMDSAYDGNRQLARMRELLDDIQSELEGYINTKDESELNHFYENEEEYKAIVETFWHEGTMTKQQLCENAIANLSTEYIRLINKAALSKRSGDIMRYQEDYELAVTGYRNLTSYMANLNNTSFQENSTKYEKMYGVMRNAEFIYGLILCMMGIFDICVLLLLIRRLMMPLQNLAKTADEVGKGNLDVTLAETKDYNEIGIVNNAFNHMIESLKEYIEQFKIKVESESKLKEQSIRMEASVKEAQLKYLQAQINPHFLFNTLNAGVQLAMLEDADKTYKYILRVADFFRYKIKNDGISTVGEELKTVDDYLYIINVRFSGEIHYSKEVDEKYLGIPMPSMILQPIVENCIKHGLTDVDWEKKISISVYGEEDNIVISVSDNGVGMEDAIIHRIMNDSLTSEETEKQQGGIGLNNVITRLKVFYDRDNVAEITSVGKNLGTEIALFIPKEPKVKTNVQNTDS